jgi:hypothetical protein
MSIDWRLVLAAIVLWLLWPRGDAQQKEAKRQTNVIPGNFDKRQAVEDVA